MLKSHGVFKKSKSATTLHTQHIGISVEMSRQRHHEQFVCSIHLLNDSCCCCSNRIYTEERKKVQICVYLCTYPKENRLDAYIKM